MNSCFSDNLRDLSAYAEGCLPRKRSSVYHYAVKLEIKLRSRNTMNQNRVKRIGICQNAVYDLP